MAEVHEKHELTSDSLINKITEKFHSHDSSSLSSSNSDNDREEKPAAKIYRLFGLEKPVHKDGKPFQWLRSSPKIPEVIIPEDVILSVASAFRVEFNRGFAIIRDIARGRDLKKFVAVIVGLWVLSVLGSWCSFLTLFYVGFILVHTVPVIYEKYDAQIDAFAERAEAEFKKQYAVFDAKVSSKIPKGIKDKLP